MKILIVSATELELAPLKKIFSDSSNHEIETLVTGVGMTATAFSLGRNLATKQFDLAINVGLAGAFDRSLQLGEVVWVIEDQLSEEGAEDGDKFLSLEEMRLQGIGVLKIIFPEIELKYTQVKGITVNTVHGNDASIKEVISRLNPQVETMEGAAFLYACKMNQISCIQIRAISNYVEKRNRAAWKINLALNNLAESIDSIIKQLNARA